MVRSLGRPEFNMIEKMLEQLADKVLTLDENSLTELLPHYKQVMEKFEPTPEWEKAVIIFFLINSVRVKNSLFNENILKEKKKRRTPRSGQPLKRIK